MLLRPTCGIDLGVTTDLADHNDGLSLGIVIKHLQHFQMVRAIDRIPTDADTGALAVTELGELENGLVGKSPGAGNDTDISTLVNVTRSDADPAAAVGFLTQAGGDEAWAVRAD